MHTDQRMILAVATGGLIPEARRTSFIPLGHGAIESALYAAGLWLGPRTQLEEMPAYRQIIPYVALQVEDRFVQYTRTAAGGESRLHGRVSIGLGGHIDLSDVVVRGNSVDLMQTLEASAQREVDEELAGVDCMRKEWIGLLVDNDSSVGQVHIGVVGLWQLRSEPHGSAEDAIGETGLTTLAQLRDVDPHRLETWSSLLCDGLRRLHER
jgi:predicted NUDIX family phosphoesterase